MAKKTAKMSEGGRSKPDPLDYRIGANIDHKFPREGQTNFHNIPMGNNPEATKFHAPEWQESIERRRANRTDRVKKLIKESLGTHRAPKLPKAKGGQVKKMCGGGW